MYLSSKDANLTNHHHYQLATIFLFVFGFFLFFPFYILMDELQLQKTLWQWIFFVPWMAFYIFWSLKERAKVNELEKKDPLKRPIVHWILLGLAALFVSLQPSDLNTMKSIDLAFIIFSFFVADGYWDFKNFRL